MATVKKESLEKIIKLLLKDFSTEEIAKLTNYSIGTIRKVLEELRAKYDVNSKTGIATAYFNERLSKIQHMVEELADLTNLSCKITPSSKTCRKLKNATKRK